MKAELKDLTLLTAVISLLIPVPTLAQSTGEDPQLEEMIIVGTRRVEQALDDAAVPVDIIQGEDLMSQGSTDLDDLLRTTTLSYNVQRHAIDDEGTLVRGATLRGLAPDAALLLVNEKRRHRSAAITFLGSSLNAGSQGPDMFVIPAIAVKRIDVLRDGAAAQYGSDAIAGVINVQLKDEAEGGMLEARYGEYYEGDGALVQVAGNIGLPLGSAGFLNLSAEYKELDPTIRSVQRAEAALLHQRGYPVADPAQIWGNPVIDDSINSFYNLAIELGNWAELYSFGNYAERRSEGGFFFRAPGTANARNGVFRSGGVRLVADLAPEDDLDCQAAVPGLEATNAEVQAFIEASRSRCFLFNERFPGGFTPRFGADITDMSTVVGLRGDTLSGWSWDLSVGAAESDVGFFMRNTINASLGPETPVEFKPRTYTQTDVNVNFDLSYPLYLAAFHSPLNIALGAEWRQEHFEVSAGDEASWIIGPYADGRISNAFSVGSNGFQGLAPKNAGDWKRPNYAAYVDLEADVTESLLLGVAARFEDFYNDFGDTINGKVSARWRMTDDIVLRGTFSTGFRAPSPGQANISLLSTTFSGTGNLVEVGTVPPHNPVALAFGGEPMHEEKSVGFSLGFSYHFRNDVQLRFDFFQIEIDDRIVRTGNIGITPEVAALLEQSGLAAASGVQNISFNTNDFDTTTRGIDLGLDYELDWQAGTTALHFGWNWTDTSLDEFSPPREVTEILGQQLENPLTVSLLTKRRRLELEELNPPHRLMATLTHLSGDWQVLLRGSYYTDWKACRFAGASCANLDSYDGDFLLDAEVSYRFRDTYSLAFGAQNLFDTTPGAVRAESLGQGNAQPESSPYDYNGGFFYFRLGYEF